MSMHIRDFMLHMRITTLKTKTEMCLRPQLISMDPQNISTNGRHSDELREEDSLIEMEHMAEIIRLGTTKMELQV